MHATQIMPLDLSNLRYWRQNAERAVRDVYDAFVELITNADDRYVILGRRGKIEIEVERRRKGAPNVVRVRDFADGMRLEDMKRKLAKVGDRVSGMAQGKPVRGTNSRGAKDVAVLGGVIFESIADDGRYHKFEISQAGYCTPYEPSPKATVSHRRQLGILVGTGTLVTLTVSSEASAVPQHETLKDQLRLLVPLRDIFGSPDREIILTDSNKSRTDVIKAPSTEGHDLLKDRLSIPGYPEADAKLVIRRSDRPLAASPSRFREAGILVKSVHAIHEATYFAPELEHDPHAAWFFGRLKCEYIDRLWNEYDNRLETGLKLTPENPRWIYDPMRQGGLSREHPFVKALFREALKKLRPLVEEERKRHENSKAHIESTSTRQRLRLLEREAAKFMNRHQDDDETSREPNDPVMGSEFRQRGFSLSPPFAQLILGQTARFWLNVDQEAFPELSVGDTVEIGCATDEISINKTFTPLEPHPGKLSILRAVWTVTAERVTHATAVTARVGPLVAESTIEVLLSEREKFVWVTKLAFGSKRYSVRKESRKSITILAPLEAGQSAAIPFEIECDHRAFSINGDRYLIPQPTLGVSIGKLRVTASESDCHSTLFARARGQECSAEIRSLEPFGASIKIKIENVDHKNQRYLWRSNLLEIAAKHPSLSRYLGRSPEFPGQEEKHFRLLLAEIVADAVCARILGRNAELRPAEYEDNDWDAYYAEYSQLLTEFLPIAHASQVRDP